jgi:muramidase (phage lysozyme)
MFNPSGAPVDPSTLIPGIALRPPISPPSAPDYLAASVTPGSTQQVPVTTGYDVPSRVQAASAQLRAPPQAPPAAPPAPPTANLPTVNAPPPPPPGTTAQPAADPLGQVLNHINGPESGAYPNPYMTMYGGQQINEQTPSLPGYFGFPVTPPMFGPDGRPTSATGKAQWEKDTWKDAATQYQAAGNPAPDFRKPADQDAVQRFWVSKLYKERTGRDAVADAAAGKFDYSKLTDQWPTLGGNQYPGHQYVEDIRNRYGAMSDKLNKGLESAIKELNAGSGDLAETMKRIRAAQDRADQAQDAAMKAIAKAPEKPDMDGVKHISGLATIVGLLGGLFTKAPMLASTNAAAAALEAYNAGDLRNYNIAYKTWENQTNMLFKIADMNASRVRDIMNEEKLPLEERRAKVDVLLRALGLSQVADEARIKGDQTALDWTEKMFDANQRFQERMAQLEATKAYREQTLAGQGVDVKDESGRVIGRYNFATKKLEPYPEGMTPASTTAAQAGAQDEEQEIARREREFVTKYKAEHNGEAPSQDDIVAERYKIRRAVQREAVQTKRVPIDDLKPVQRVEFDRRHADFIKNNPDADADAILRQDWQNYLDITGDKARAAHAGTKGGDEAAALQKVINDDLAEYKKNHPDAKPADLDREEFNARLKYEGELAQRNRRQPLGLGAIWMQQWMRENPNPTAEQIVRAQAAYTHQLTVEKAYANGPIARNVQALNTVADHIKLMREYSRLLNNGETVRANAVRNTLQTELGWSDATNFETAATIMSDEIVRLLTTTGGTAEDRQGMREHFSRNSSPEQIGGALDVAEAMVAGRFKALEQGYAGNDPSRRRTFEGEILTQDARDLFLKHGNVTPGGHFGATQDDPVHIPAGTDADVRKAFDDLMPGTYFVDPSDNQVKQK